MHLERYTDPVYLSRSVFILALTILNIAISRFENRIDHDQLASENAL